MSANSGPYAETKLAIGKRCTLIVQSRLMAGLTGTCMARIQGDLVELEYTDGSFESARLSPSERRSSWFGLVALIQDRSRHPYVERRTA
ncbi:MAG: hypothetical protein ACYDAG_02510 [Chloroflexota bacterium]